MQQLSVSLLIEQGNEYLDQNLYEAALEVFQQAENLEHGNPQILYAIGLCLFSLRDYKNSIKYLDEVLRVESNSILSLARRGMAYQKLKLSEQAEIDFVQAVTIQPQNYEDLRGRGLAQMRLRKYDEAVESYTQACELCPSDHLLWCNRANALLSVKQHQEALVSLDEAIKIKPNYHHAWRDRGILLRNLKRTEEALASYEKALAIQPNDDNTWLHQGHLLQQLGRCSEALESYKKASELNPNDHSIKASYDKAYEKLIKKEKGLEIKSIINNGSLLQIGDAFKLNFQYKEALAKYNEALKVNPNDSLAWSKCGEILALLNRYHEAIDSYEKALKINPEDSEVWFKQAIAIAHTGKPARAITGYKRAISINPNYAQAWNGLGNAFKALSNYAQAIKAYDEAINCATQIKKLYYYCWRPFNNRGWALFKCSGYTAAILNWNKALRDYLQPDKALHKEGCGIIHHSKGKAHYIYGSQQNNPLSYWREAKKSYESALASLTFDLFPEQHLEVLQDLIRVCRNLGQNQVASELLHTGSDLLERLLQETTFNDKKIQLAQRFASFNQLRVDELAESGNIQEQIKALQLAEERKNICLSWLRDGWTDKASCSLKYEDIQHLLNDQTVIVYWHISPAAISTFILKHNCPPIVLSAKAKSSNFAYPAKIKQLQEFETWMSAWKNDYQNYRQQCLRKDNVRSFKTKAKWFKEMPMRLEQLSEILNVEAIIPYISNITNLILIPHRDLHLLPIHACFPEELTVVYLPSAQIGLNLQHLTTNENNSIFSIDNPRSDLNFAIIESTIVSLLYPGSEKLKTQLATRESVIHGLNQQLSCFHFAGHAYHNSNYPKKSALELANREVLTLEDLFTIELCGCNLVCLSACETGLTSKHDLLDEYVGLVSGFLAAGTSRVISTLWAIHSEAAALLMIDFHLRRQMGKSEPYALAEAVRWLKNVTVKELSIWYKHILSKLPDNELSIRPFLETELDKLSLKKGDDKLYEHPYYWAAFTVTGRTC